MPIHIRAEPGEYAEACLLPGDPLRAKYIAETYFDNPVQRNGERGMLGYTGEWEGTPVSVQATGMGCPSAAIVMEELVQLGVKRFLRVGTENCFVMLEDVMANCLAATIDAGGCRKVIPSTFSRTWTSKVSMLPSCSARPSRSP